MILKIMLVMITVMMVTVIVIMGMAIMVMVVLVMTVMVTSSKLSVIQNNQDWFFIRCPFPAGLVHARCHHARLMSPVLLKPGLIPKFWLGWYQCYRGDPARSKPVSAQCALSSSRVHPNPAQRSCFSQKGPFDLKTLTVCPLKCDRLHSVTSQISLCYGVSWFSRQSKN